MGAPLTMRVQRVRGQCHRHEAGITFIRNETEFALSLPLERRGGGEAKDKYGIHDPSRRQEGRDAKQMGCSMEYTG